MCTHGGAHEPSVRSKAAPGCRTPNRLFVNQAPRLLSVEVRCSLCFERIAGADVDAAGVVLQVQRGDIDAERRHQAAGRSVLHHTLAVPLQGATQIAGRVALVGYAQVKLLRRGAGAGSSWDALQLAGARRRGWLVFRPGSPGWS